MKRVRHLLRPDERAAVCGQYGPFSQLDERERYRVDICETCRRRWLGGVVHAGDFVWVVRR